MTDRIEWGEADVRDAMQEFDLEAEDLVKDNVAIGVLGYRGVTSVSAFWGPLSTGRVYDGPPMIPGMPFDDPIEAIQYARALEGRGAEGTKMKRTTDKHHSNRVRQQARRLAKKLDCSVCAHRLRGQEYNYYVYGAPSLYGDGTAPGIREDVHEGNNRLGDWDEVLERLESYQVDIWLYTRGVSASLSWEIQTKAPRHLLTAWINGDMTAGMALADMFSEGGEEVLSGTIREALQHQPEMP